MAKKGTRVRNAVSGAYATISGEPRDRESCGGQVSKWAYGVRLDTGQYRQWAAQNVIEV